MQLPAGRRAAADRRGDHVLPRVRPPAAPRLRRAQRWSGIAGIDTEWDFVEAPSQLLEEWTRDAATLARFAVHHETGEVLPAEMVARMRAADEFGKGLFVRQQMFYADLSLELYSRDPAGVDPLALELETRARHLPYSNVDGMYMHLSFGHLEGYSAIYYTYMWSLVIAKDLFTAFDQANLLARRGFFRVPGKSAASGGFGAGGAACARLPRPGEHLRRVPGLARQLDLEYGGMSIAILDTRS